MPTNTSPSLQVPESFKIKINAYDDDELELLKKLDQWKLIEPYINSGVIELQKQKFLRYSMFRQGDIYTHDQLTGLVDARGLLLSHVLTFRNGTIGINPDIDASRHRSEAEDVGEAIGLSVADKIFGTSDLDWSRIKESNSRTLDTTASTTEVKIEWESKGSFIHEGPSRPPTVGNHKRSIKEKKMATGATGSTDAVRLGSIAIVRGDTATPSNVYLVDPPVEFQARNPAQVRILNRLRNIANLISTLKPRSQLAAAIQSRIAALGSLSDFSQLDSVELRSGTSEPFNVSPGDDGTHSTFFSARSTVDGENVGGLVLFIDSDWLFFYGMQGELVELAASEQFQGISDYESTNLSTERTVNCTLARGAFTRETGKKPDQIRDIVRTNGQYVSFSAIGELNYTAGSSVFGWLNRPEGL